MVCTAFSFALFARVLRDLQAIAFGARAFAHCDDDIGTSAMWFQLEPADDSWFGGFIPRECMHMLVFEHLFLLDLIRGSSKHVFR